MSLNYDFSKTIITTDFLNQLYKSSWGDEDYLDLRPEYKAMVFATMTVGIGHIRNEKEAKEFWYRIRFYEKMFSPIMSYWQDKLVTTTHTLDGIEREFIVLEGKRGDERREFLCGLFLYPIDDIMADRLPELKKMDDQVCYYFETVDEVKAIIGKDEDFLDGYTVWDLDFVHRENDSCITEEIVNRCIGMTTNVTTKTRASWLKHLMKQRELFPTEDAFKGVK